MTGPLTCDIERLGAAGDGVARVGAQEIFVPFSVPGETVTGTRVGDRLTEVKILSPAPDRVKAPCRHFRSCGGCATQHIRPEVLAEWKRAAVAETLARVGLHPELPPTRSSAPQSRRRAVFAGRRTKSGAMVGFHARQSDVIVPISECHLLRPELLATLPALSALTRLGASRKSVLRLSVTATGGGADVDVEGGRDLTGPDRIALAAIAGDHDLARLAWGGEVVVERRPPQIALGTTTVLPPPGAFLQATAHGQQALTEEVRRILGSARPLIDLFAGCGTFTLPLAAQAEVHAVESWGPMLAALDRGWRHGRGLRPVTTETRDLFRNPVLAEELNRFGAILLDPPRAGAAAQVAQIAQSTVRTVAYVSCNPATFARDARTLSQAGFHLDRVQVVDQFLWSGHTELAAGFHR